MSNTTVSKTSVWSGLLAQSDFLPPAVHSQDFPPAFSLFIRQTNGTDELHQANLIHTEAIQDEYVLVVGHIKPGGEVLQEQLKEKLPGRHVTFWLTDKIEDVPTGGASACTSVLLIADMTRPVCTSMTEGALEVLKWLMQPGKAILWVTVDARHDPKAAASLGLTRSLKAEIPDLILQVVDLERHRTSGALIAKQFARLLQYREHSRLSDDTNRSLISLEPEIHIDEGKRLIPRVLPYKPSND